METHDQECELMGGFHGCKCWLRGRGRHSAMKSLDDWYGQQHEEDRFNLAPLMDRMHEALHIVDREQERMSARVRQNDQRSETP
jgi:hypothetical protein